MALIFDPHAAELLGYDLHLPAVSAEAWTREALVHRFLQPPVWTPEVRVDRALPVQGSTPAAVLIPLVMRPQPTVLLTQRTSHLSKHAGQISFPGGRVEPHDPDVCATALRETHGEIGLAAERIEVLGRLPDYRTGTGFCVSPVVGLVYPPFVLTPDSFEVAEVFEVPLAFLLDPAHHQRAQLEVRGGLRSYHTIPYGNYFIWGATAGMLVSLYRFLSR